MHGWYGSETRFTYLRCHLPDTVNELEEDRGSLVITVVPVAMADTLARGRRNDYRGWGEVEGVIRCYQMSSKVQLFGSLYTSHIF